MANAKKGTSSGMDAIAALMADHKKVKDLFKHFRNLTDDAQDDKGALKFAA